MKKKTAVIFDVDGTLVDVSAIRHYVTGENKNFDKFHCESINCPPNKHVVEMACNAKKEGHDVIIVTSRTSKFSKLTAFWLADNNVPSDAFFMRQDGDFRKDYFVKKDILKLIQQKWDIVHAVDDNPAVIQLWHENNIPTTIIDGYK